MSHDQIIFIGMGVLFFVVIGILVYLGNNYNLDNIKAKEVGNGQYGNSRFATQKEINETFSKLYFDPQNWRKGKHLPHVQGIVIGSQVKGGQTYCYVDKADAHLLMIGAAGVGKTATFVSEFRICMCKWHELYHHRY